MTRILVAAAAALAIASPALAEKPGGAAAFAIQHFAQDHETGDGPKNRTLPEASQVVVSTSNQAKSAATFARQHFAQDHEPGDGPRRVRLSENGGTVIVSTSNNDLAAFARAKLINDGERGNK